MTFPHFLRRQSAAVSEHIVRLAAPRGFLSIEIIPKLPDGSVPPMPPPLSPAYAAMSLDIARARLAAELLTTRASGFRAPFHLPRLFFLYLRVRQATVLAQGIAAAAAAAQVGAKESDSSDRASPPR